MLGAIIGDIVGSVYQWHNCKSKDFPFYTYACYVTDDSVMTLAVAQALLEAEGCPEKLSGETVRCMRSLGRRYNKLEYGSRFREWLQAEEPQPYRSWGNGSAMRISPVGYAARSEEEVKRLSRIVTDVTHNHPEAEKGAEAAAMAVYLARHGMGPREMHAYMDARYYKVDYTLDQVRGWYEFDVSCAGTVPYALAAFYESCSFEDAVRNAVSVGGDSDTITCITGGIAQAYYGIPDRMRVEFMHFLDAGQREILDRFETRYASSFAVPGRLVRR